MVVTGDPVIETYPIEGLIGCSVTTAVVTGTLCGEECVGSDPVPRQCTKPDPNDKTVLNFTIFNDTRTLILEFVWTPMGGVSGDRLLFRFHGCKPDENGQDTCPQWGHASGKSPARAEYNATRNGERFNFTEPRRMVVWAFGDFGIVPKVFIQQRFTMYVTTALYFPAPPDYSGLPDQ